MSFSETVASTTSHHSPNLSLYKKQMRYRSAAKETERAYELKPKKKPNVNGIPRSASVVTKKKKKTNLCTKIREVKERESGDRDRERSEGEEDDTSHGQIPRLQNRADRLIYRPSELISRGRVECVDFSARQKVQVHTRALTYRIKFCFLPPFAAEIGPFKHFIAELTVYMDTPAVVNSSRE